MKRKLIVAIALCAGFVVAGARAQDPAPPPHDMANMPGMNHNMTANTDITNLMDRLSKSLSAIETEKKAGPRKEKIAAHAALLKELQTKLEAQGGMPGMVMGHMMGMGNMPMGKMPMGDMKDMKCCENMAGMDHSKMGAMGGMNCAEMMKK